MHLTDNSCITHISRKQRHWTCVSRKDSGIKHMLTEKLHKIRLNTRQLHWTFIIMCVCVSVYLSICMSICMCVYVQTCVCVDDYTCEDSDLTTHQTCEDLTHLWGLTHGSSQRYFKIWTRMLPWTFWRSLVKVLISIEMTEICVTLGHLVHQ